MHTVEKSCCGILYISEKEGSSEGPSSTKASHSCHIERRMPDTKGASCMLPPVLQVPKQNSMMTIGLDQSSDYFWG